MQKAITLQPQPRAWLEDSILRPFVSQYGEHLQRRRYAPSTQRAYLCCVAHFAYWLTQERYDLEAIGPGAVMRFLSAHQPACACPDPVRRLRHELQGIGPSSRGAQGWRRGTGVSGPHIRHRTGADALRCPHARRLGIGGQHASEALPSGRGISCRAFRRAADLHGDRQCHFHPPLRPRQTGAKTRHRRRERRYHWLLSPFPQHVRRAGGRSEGRDSSGRTLAVGIIA